MRYDSKSLVKASRFVEWFPLHDETFKSEVYNRIDELVMAEAEYCDKGNYKHLANIFTALAVYWTLRRHGATEEEAYNTVSSVVWEYVEKHMAPDYRKISKAGFFFPLIRKMLPTMFAKGSGYGWKYTWHPEEQKHRLRFECNSCIYAQILPKYGAPKLGGIFCHCDILNYGELYDIDFIRTETLCQTGNDCNFLFVKHPREETFTRTKSI